MSEDFPDTTDCPQCGEEGAYFNGFQYECPECGYEWTEDDDDTEEEDSDDDDEDSDDDL
ncbi:MAG: hypothetical protein LBP19_05490 [Treponema sp.]|jgi:protein PhnA|nr:hypothetical protein [Treponema sp.]